MKFTQFDLVCQKYYTHNFTNVVVLEVEVSDL